MRRLLSIEWSKLYNYKAARIFTIIYFALLFIGGYFISQYKPSFIGLDFNLKELGYFDFPYIWQNLTYLFAIAKIFLGVIIIMNITNEYTYGTMKQNLIDGLRKNEFINSKIYTAILSALLSTIILFIIAVILGMIFSNTKYAFYEGIEYLTAYFVKLSFFFVLCTFLAVLVRKSVFSFLLLIVWWIAELIIYAIELNVKNAEKTEDILLSNFLPMNASSNLISFTKFETSGILINQSAFQYTPISTEYLITCIIYIFLFIYLTKLILKKRDL